MNIGDAIKCKDLDDMIKTMGDLKDEGVSVVWKAEDIIAGKHILHVTAIEEERHEQSLS